MRTACFFVYCLMTLPLHAANDKEQANAYDNAWEQKWVAHCRQVYRVAGKTPGFTLQIGDTVARSNPNTQWPRKGAGKTSEDLDICTWMSASQWSAKTSPEIGIKNGWYLAAMTVGARRSYTTLNSVRPADLVSGSHRGGPAMPKVLFPPEAVSIISDGIAYPSSLQIDTVAAAFEDAQFAVLLLGSADTGRKRSPTEVAADLKRVVFALEQRHIVVIISTLPPDFNADNLKMVLPYNEAIRGMAQEHGLPLIDFYQEIMARQPGESWKTTLIDTDIYPTAVAGDLDSTSDPYAPDGDKATHRTGANASNLGYLLRSWLTVQKMKEIKARLVDVTRQDINSELAALQAVLDKAQRKERDAAAESLCDLYLQSNRTQDAMALCDKMTAEAGNDARRVAEWLFAKIRLLQATPDTDIEMMAVYRRIIDTCSKETSFGAQARIYLAELLLKRGKTGEAVMQCQAALGDPNIDPEIETWLLGRLSGLLMAGGQIQEAIKLSTGAIDRELVAGTRSTRLLTVGDLCLREKQAGEALKIYQRVILEYADNPEACFVAQKAIFNIHVEMNDRKSATADALRFYAAANTTARMSEALALVAQALRTLDGKGDRAIEFLKWQKEGPPKPPADKPAAGNLFETVLADCPFAPQGEELALLNAATEKLGNSANDRRKRAYLNLFFGRPKNAMPDLKANFETCALDPLSIQMAADDVAAGLKAIDGHPFRVPVFFEIMTYGAAGKSGQEHLIDPLKDF